MPLSPVVYPLVILHAKPPRKWNSQWGVREAGRVGATALDVDGRYRNGRWVAAHWPREEHDAPTMRDVMAAAADAGVTVCMEAKTSGDFNTLRADAEATGCRLVVMTLPHLGGKNNGYNRLRDAHAAGLPTLVLLNTTRFGRGQVPADKWKYLTYTKGPAIWQRGRPSTVIRLGGGSRYGISASTRNARTLTKNLRRFNMPPAPLPPTDGAAAVAQPAARPQPVTQRLNAWQRRRLARLLRIAHNRRRRLKGYQRKALRNLNRLRGK